MSTVVCKFDIESADTQTVSVSKGDFVTTNAKCKMQNPQTQQSSKQSENKTVKFHNSTTVKLKS